MIHQAKEIMTNMRTRIFLTPSDPMLNGKYKPESEHVHVVCDSAGAAFTVTMPDLRNQEKREFVIYNLPSSGAGNTVTIAAEWFSTGAATYSLSANSVATFVSDMKKQYLVS